LFVLKILVSKFFENKILRNPFPETRARQGFRRHRNKKNTRDPLGTPERSHRKTSAELYFGGEIHNKGGGLKAES
jgi:hypothetical protein